MKIEEYQDLRGKSVFREWFEELDTQTALVVNRILTRMKYGNSSNIKAVGNSVYERTIDYGPGYRIYFGKEDLDIVILLCAGSKKWQQKDIDKAKFLWKEYKGRKNLRRQLWH